MTTGELAILRLLLPSGNPNSELLFQQATKAPHVERKLVQGGYEVVIPYVRDDSILIECDENLESPALEISTVNGIKMAFSTMILRGGFLYGLRGQRLDGSAWDKDWKPDMACLTGLLSLPDWIPVPVCPKVIEKALMELCRWSGIEDENLIKQAKLVFRGTSPATSYETAVSEQRLNVRLGRQYQEFVEITNGCSINAGRMIEVLGCKDIDYVGDAKNWIGVTPLSEDGFVVLACKDGLVLDECFLLGYDGSATLVGDLKRHVRNVLTGTVRNS